MMYLYLPSWSFILCLVLCIEVYLLKRVVKIKITKQY